MDQERRKHLKILKEEGVYELKGSFSMDTKTYTELRKIGNWLEALYSAKIKPISEEQIIFVQRSNQIKHKIQSTEKASLPELYMVIDNYNISEVSKVFLKLKIKNKISEKTKNSPGSISKKHIGKNRKSGTNSKKHSKRGKRPFGYKLNNEIISRSKSSHLSIRTTIKCIKCSRKISIYTSDPICSSCSKVTPKVQPGPKKGPRGGFKERKGNRYNSLDRDDKYRP